MTLIALLLDVGSARAERSGRTAIGQSRRSPLAANPYWLLLRLNYGRLLLRSWQDTFPRMLWAGVPFGLAWWLIHDVGNHRDARLFLHLSMAAFVGIFSGAYKTLADGRIGLTHFAKSTAYGQRILYWADYCVVASLGAGILFSFLLFFYVTNAILPLRYVATAAVYYVAVLLLFGHQWLQTHRHMIVLKFALGMLAAVIGMQLGSNFI
jgi:hypothetical protein